MAEPDRKKKRLSLSLRKPTEERFDLVTDTDVQEAEKGVVPNNTNWAIQNFTDWMENRNSLCSDDPIPSDVLSTTDPELLSKWLRISVLETRQKSGKPYPPKLYNILCGIYRTCRDNGLPFKFLDKSDARFCELHRTLDSVCSKLHSEGVGASKKSASIISITDEDLFWDGGIVSYDSPQSLQNMVFFYAGLHEVFKSIVTFV